MTQTEAQPFTELPRPPTLHELTAGYAEIKRLLDRELWDDRSEEQPEEALQGALNQALAQLTDAIDKKSEGIAKVILQQEAEAELIASQGDILQREVDRLHRLAERKRKGALWLRSYLASELASLGEETQRFQSLYLTVTLAKRPANDRVVVEDETKVPIEFLRGSVTAPLAELPRPLRERAQISVDKQAILKLYREQGVVPPGCRTEPGPRPLRIY
ncbi:MAG: siphovirus Gp157 family protein [Candidatus Nitrosotenuis sp.]